MHCTLDLELSPLLTEQTDTLLVTLLAKADVAMEQVTLVRKRIQQSGMKTNVSMAAIAANADGLVANDGNWILAEPVHLVLQRDSFSLYPQVPLKLAREEAESYQATLNQHFKSEGLAFYLGRSGQWYVNVQSSSVVDSFHGLANPLHAQGQPVEKFLQKQAGGWLQVQNELQMLLFDSLENQAREQAGQLALNSIWFYGAEAMPSHSQKNTRLHYLSNAPFYQGLAEQSGSQCEALPQNASFFESVLAQHHAKDIVVDLTPVNDWEDWLVICQKLLKRRIIKKLTFNIGFQEKTLVANITPSSFWRFWRKPRPIIDYL